MIKLFARIQYVILSWAVLTAWSTIWTLGYLDGKFFELLYWDLIFAILIALTLVTTTSAFALLIGWAVDWLLVPAVLYLLFDEVENTIALVQASGRLPVYVSGITPAKYFFLIAALLTMLVSGIALALRKFRHAS